MSSDKIVATPKGMTMSNDKSEGIEERCLLCPESFRPDNNMGYALQCAYITKHDLDSSLFGEYCGTSGNNQPRYLYQCPKDFIIGCPVCHAKGIGSFEQIKRNFGSWQYGSYINTGGISFVVCRKCYVLFATLPPHKIVVNISPEVTPADARRLP
jgi:hypothetical protein